MALPGLVVGDDDRHVLHFVELLLQGEFQVLGASNGREVLAARTVRESPNQLLRSHPGG